MKLSSIHHAAIIVSDYKKSRNFLRESAGFPGHSGALQGKREMTGSWILQVGEGPDAVELEIFWRAEPSEACKQAGGLRAETPGVPGGECGGDGQGAGSPWHFLRTNPDR